MNKLHPTQQNLLSLLRDTINDPLTVRELQKRLGLSSTSVVQHHILQLIKKGHLRRNPANPNDYQIIDGEPENKIIYLNLYGLAKCGPGGSILDGNPIDRIPLSSQLIGFSSAEAFLVKAKGDSMAPKINEGDLVITRQSSDPVDGSIIVCVNNEETMIKKVQYYTNTMFLTSLNPKYSPIPVHEDFRMQGIVKGIISYYL
jgi:repressor LexA